MTMTNKQLNSFLEALKIIIQSSSDRENILKYIEQIQTKLNE
jgi:hypothetical protein